MNQEFNKDAIRNPSSGLISRNVTHQEIAEYAEDQSDIIRAIKESGVKRIRVSYDYTDLDPANPPPLSGILKIRKMDIQDAQSFCRTLMRSRPNIFKVDINLGDYTRARRISNYKTQMLNTNKPRFHTELGDKLGDLLADRSLNVVRIVYTVHNADAGHFSASAEVYGTSAEEYASNEFFQPTITFEYIKTT